MFDFFGKKLSKFLHFLVIFILSQKSLAKSFSPIPDAKCQLLIKSLSYITSSYSCILSLTHSHSLHPLLFFVVVRIELKAFATSSYYSIIGLAPAVQSIIAHTARSIVKLSTEEALASVIARCISSTGISPSNRRTTNRRIWNE